MNLEKIEELWKKDAEAFYDHRELPELLANDSMETPRLHAKYVQFYNHFKLMLSEASAKHKQMYREKFEYYSGKAPSKVYAEKPFDLKVLKGDIPMYVDSDPEMTRQQQEEVTRALFDNQVHNNRAPEEARLARYRSGTMNALEALSPNPFEIQDTGERELVCNRAAVLLIWGNRIRSISQVNRNGREKWCVPGGKREETRHWTEWLEEAALRECQEETGFLPPEVLPSPPPCG